MGLTQIPTSMVKDFDLAGMAIGDVLTFDGTKWVAQPGVPSGTILQYAGAAPPNGWLLCDGSAINRASYAGLFAVLGTTYGNGNGTTTFNLPDFRGRVAVGCDNMGIGSANRLTSIQADVLGGSGGVEAVAPAGSISLSGTVGSTTLSSNQIPSHNHLPSVVSANWTASTSPNGWGSGTWSSSGAGAVSGGNPTTPSSAMIKNTGNGESHTHSFSGSGELTGISMDVTQPWLAINYIIKA